MKVNSCCMEMDGLGRHYSNVANVYLDQVHGFTHMQAKVHALQ